MVIGGLFIFYLGCAGQVADYLPPAWTDFRDGARAYGRVAVMLGLLLGIAFGAMGSWLIGKWLIRAAVMQAREAERQVLAKREAAAQEARCVKAAVRRIEQAPPDQLAKREQEAAAQIETAETRLQGSVSINIGRHKTIQKLRNRASGLEEDNRELRKRMGGLEDVEEATMGHCQKHPDFILDPGELSRSFSSEKRAGSLFNNPELRGALKTAGRHPPNPCMGLIPSLRRAG